MVYIYSVCQWRRECFPFVYLCAHLKLFVYVGVRLLCVVSPGLLGCATAAILTHCHCLPLPLVFNGYKTTVGILPHFLSANQMVFLQPLHCYLKHVQSIYLVKLLYIIIYLTSILSCGILYFHKELYKIFHIFCLI